MQEQRPATPPRSAPVRELARTHGRGALRIAGIALAVVAVLAGTGAVIRSLQNRGIQPISPTDVDRLVGRWTDTTGAAPLSGAAAEDGTVYVGAADGLFAYPARCAAPEGTCSPSWHDVIPDGPISTPAVFGNAVYAGSSQGRVYAFPATCDAADCPPLWSGAAGEGTVSTPGVNDDFVYVTSDKLYAFPALCGTDDRVCSPAWTGAIPGRAAPGPPAVGGGLVIVASASLEGGVVAFPAVCVSICEPVWTGDTGGPATAVDVSSHSAFVVARGSLMAFPLSCKGTCEPAWKGPFLPGEPFATGATSAPRYEGDHVYVGTDHGQLWVFPASCPEPSCHPQRGYDLGALPLLTPTVNGGVVFVASVGGVVSAIGDGCASDCSGPWSEGLGAAAAGAPAVTDDALFVGDTAGRLHAYTVSG